MFFRGKRWVFLGLVIGLMFFSLAGCGTKPAVNENLAGESSNSTYTIADPTGDWGFPSPYAHYSRGPGYMRMSYLFDTLVWKDKEGFTPALAEEWEYLEEENAYLFKLREDVSWHDGKKFTAEDVVFTFNYVKKHPYQWINPSIIKKAEVINDYSVKLILSKTYAPFLHSIAGTMPILPKHIWENVEMPVQFQEEEALIGTGPYNLVDYNKGQGTYLYEAYDEYYQGTPKIKRIKFIKISNEMAASALKQGQVNAAQVPAEMVSTLEKEEFKVLTGAHDWVAKLMFNHQKEPFSNKKFRQALAYSIDRQELVDTCLRGHALAGSPGFIPMDNDWYNSKIEQYKYNPAKTGEILNGLGYTKKDKYFEKNGKVLELELLVSGGSGAAGAPREREAEMIKNQLEKAGIKINLRSLESKTLDNMVKEWKFDLALLGHGGLGGDPEFLKKQILDDGFNSARYQKHDELNSLLLQQLQEYGEERKTVVSKIQELYALEVPSLSLYYPTWYWVHDGQTELYYTKQGVGSGVPIPTNKMSFVK